MGRTGESRAKLRIAGAAPPYSGDGDRDAERLRLAIEAAGFGEWAYDVATGSMDATPRCHALFGFAPERELIFEDICARYHPEDRDRVVEGMKAAFAGGDRQYRTEFRILLPGGEVRWIAIFGEIFRDALGRVSRSAGVAQDITPRKEAELALRGSEERFRLAMRAVSGVVYDWDLRKNEAFRSDGLAEIVGVPPDAVPSEADWWSLRIHPEDRARMAQVRSAIRAGVVTRYEEEYRVRHEAGHWVHLWDRGTVVRDGAGRPLRVVGNAADVTERKRAERALSESEERFRLAAGAVVGMVYDWDSRTGRVYRSEGLFDVIGVRPEHAPPDREWWWMRVHPDDLAHVIPRRAEILAGRLDHFEHEYRIRHENGHWIEILDRGSVVRDESGRTLRVIGTATDVTQRKQAEDRQRLLLAELDHRVKNMLAVVQSLVMQTKTSAASLDEFTAGLEGRLHAMARTHALLTQARWEGAQLDAIVTEELSPYGAVECGRIKLVGPALMLRPKAAMTLSLALHELATNAAKYGALSRPKGLVAVSWIIEEGQVHLTWQESGGPPVLPPKRRGFGIQALEQILAYEISGRARLDFAPDGLVCRVAMPLKELIAASTPESSDQVLPTAPPQPHDHAALEKRRILVVEDSALVAVEIEEAVRNLGFEVIGPVGRLAAALDLVKDQTVDGALLDINLDGAQVYPLADLLSGRGVPIIFATGYDGSIVLPPRFAAVPTLAKPFSPSELARALAAALGCS